MAAPVITSITPSSIRVGTRTTLTVNGTGLTSYLYVNRNNDSTGITVNQIRSVTATQVVFDLTVANEGDVTVFFYGNSLPSNYYTYTVLPPLPVITSVSVASVNLWESRSVTITGTGFKNAAVSFSKGSVVATSPVLDTEVTVTLTATSAGAGVVTVTTPGGSATWALPVVEPAPIAPNIVSLVPAELLIGETVNLTVNGYSLQNCTITLSGDGITYGSTTAATAANTASRYVTVSSAATLGQRVLTVTTANGSETITIPVTVKAPTITAVSPATLQQGAPSTLTVTGTNLTGAAVMYSAGSVTAVTGVSSTSLTVSCAGTLPGTGTLTVTTRGGSASSAVVTTAVLPTVSAVSVSSVLKAEPTTVTLTGTNLMGTAVTFNLGTVSEVAGTETATSKTVVITGTTAGSGTITVTNSAGSAAKSLTVTPETPKIKAVSAGVITLNVLTSITIQGINLTGATVVFSRGTCGAITNASSTGLTVGVTGTSAGFGTLTVTVGGNSTTASLEVVAYAEPVITSLSTTQLAIGDTNRTLLIQGSGFTAATVAINALGVTTSATLDSATQITLAYTIASSAVPLTTQLTVRNPLGSASVPVSIGWFYPTRDASGLILPNPSLPIVEGALAPALITAFDSGVEQRRKKGAARRTWEFTYNALREEQYRGLFDFFLQCGGPVKAFSWTHPATQLQYTVRFNMDSLAGEYIAHTLNGPVYKLSLKLLEVL